MGRTNDLTGGDSFQNCKFAIRISNTKTSLYCIIRIRRIIATFAWGPRQYISLIFTY